MTAPDPASLARQRFNRGRWLVALCALGTAGFVGCFGVAIAAYPGGTWFNRRAQGHSFAKNFLCDLMQTRALNGHPAPLGSVLARLGMAAMLVALAAFFVQVGRLAQPPTRAARVTRWAGLLACVLGFAVPLAPSDQFRDGHIIAVVSAFIPGLVATIAALVVCLRAPRVSRWLRAAALVTLVAGGIDGLLYAFVYASPLLGIVPASRPVRAAIAASLPLFQRVATLGLLAWVIAICLHTVATLRANHSQPAD